MRLKDLPKLSSQELQWCTGNLGSSWSKRILRCHNNILKQPWSKDAQDDMKLAVHMWRSDQNYPFRRVVNILPNGKPNP